PAGERRRRPRGLRDAAFSRASIGNSLRGEGALPCGHAARGAVNAQAISRSWVSGGREGPFDFDGHLPHSCPTSVEREGGQKGWRAMARTRTQVHRRANGEPLRYAHPFYTAVPPDQRPEDFSVHGPRMSAWIAQESGPIPPPTRPPTMQLNEVIGDQGV